MLLPNSQAIFINLDHISKLEHLSKLDHILRKKLYINFFSKTEITQIMLSVHNGIKTRNQ